ncbi:EAL domain-containing protein [Zhenpiania hominis]|uniref:EAL domain-containing protein n=1 Tax=Zhenpiania hominis TaxID=2763644 RepID=A0A923SRZ9_9FIRM|nr:EAL domain-containing protein [Zhenpiania hominis]
MLNELLIEEIIKEERISPVYQPIVSLSTGEIFGYEALSRFDLQRNESDTVSTRDIFQTAYQSGQLWDLERLCRKKALEGARHISHGLKLFLNVSPNVIHDNQFRSGFTNKYLNKYGISATDVVFELTEHMAIENMDSFKSVLNHYRRQGYETALDDVGAGESGLNTLLALNPTYLKLDMEIIRDIEKHHNKRSLVKAFVQFANTSNTILIAEGIETEKELAVLSELGVDYGQGFYLGRPEPQLCPLREDVRETLSGLLRTPRKTIYQPLTLKKIMKNDEINQYIDSGNLFLERLGYTEHSRIHSAKVSCTAGKILAELNYPEEEVELARIAGYMHDIGNCVNRTDHAHTGGILAFQILTRMNIDPAEIAKIVGAIGNHDERTGCATEPISAALIIADKTDVRRNRVRNPEKTDFDIHDRVNYAAVSSELQIRPDKKEIQLDIELDNEICSIMDYFEIFLERMLMCRRAAEVLGCTFKLIANGSQVL